MMYTLQIVIEHDEFGYSIPYKKTKQQPASRQDSFEQTQTLDRTKNILMKEEMTKAPSEGVVIPAIPPSLNLPERASMPVEPMDSNGYELIDISFPPAKKETNRNPPVQTTSFIEVEQQDDKKSEVASIKNKVVDFKVETEINDTALLQVRMIMTMFSNLTIRVMYYIIMVGLLKHVYDWHDNCYGYTHNYKLCIIIIILINKVL